MFRGAFFVPQKDDGIRRQSTKSAQEKKIIKKLSFVGILGNVLLAAFKLTAGLLGRSGAMVSDAVHSLSDVFATFIAFLGVLLSRQPEDAEHPYGHERLESAASLILGLILAGTGLGIGYTGLHKLAAGEELKVPTLLPLNVLVHDVLCQKAALFRVQGRCLASSVGCIIVCRLICRYCTGEDRLSDHGPDRESYHLPLYTEGSFRYFAGCAE